MAASSAAMTSTPLAESGCASAAGERQSERSLRALYQLVNVLLARERGTRSAIEDALVSDWRRIPLEEWLLTIRRQKLVRLLHQDPLVADLLPALATALLPLVRQEFRDALLLAELTLEIADAFDRAAIPALVIKGIPLAFQTTGAVTGRGSSTDLDLWVAPRCLGPAIRLLERHGFAQKRGEFPHRQDSLWWRYSRWVGYELTLQRDPQEIDLHWALGHVRAPLPGFEQAWRERELLPLRGRTLATLSRRHAFVHACAHAAKDQWSVLRHLVDLDRLASAGPEVVSPQARGTVALSCAVAHALTANPALVALMQPAPIAALERARHRAHAAQLRMDPPWKRAEGAGWSARAWSTNVRHLLGLSSSPLDWLRLLCFFLLQPGRFNDPETGGDRGLRQTVAATRKGWEQRFVGGLQRRRGAGGGRR